LSLELEPDNAIANNNYALFLTNIRKNHDQAEAYYKKSLELEPDNAIYQLHYQVQVLRIFYNTLLLGRDLCEYSLKRVRNCH
jgi:tetratricopeptide (TPR) repeat protein